MRTVLPILWFICGGLSLLAPVVQRALSPATSNHVAILATSLPQALIALASSVAIGLVYMLVIRSRYSVALLIFGVLHLIAAIGVLTGRLLGDTLRDELYSNISGTTEIGQQLAIVYGATAIVSLVGWLQFIIAMIIALNTRPAPSADVF